MNVIPVILCGGSGTRLWPLSRSAYPKQLLKLTGGQTMLQATISRLAPLALQVGQPIVVCNDSQRFIVGRQLTEISIEASLILEPAGRNTAPALTLAALRAEAAGDAGAALLVLPADHNIEDGQAFANAVESAMPAAASGALVTFGVPPTRAETGYGYILVSGSEAGPVPVTKFVEKPDLKTAESFLKSGDYFWNSGIFLCKASAWLASMAEHAPDILSSCRAAFDGASIADGVIKPDTDAFLACRAESIDYAVMENTTLATMVRLTAGWNDVGSWAALQDISEHDAEGNTLVGDTAVIDCRNSYFRAESRLLAAVGLDGCIVVETKDVVLVVPRERAQDVKRLVDELAAKQREQVKLGREVFRPWGSYDSLDSAAGYQVKRLTVLPGAILSLQLHRYRAEHWIVVSGTARITLNDEEFDLGKNEHVFIPLGARHRIENPGDKILHIIEVQVGDYLGEDDIQRFEDRYGRQGRTD